MASGLEEAHQRRQALGERVREHGESRLRAVAEAIRAFDRLLEGYRDSATGTGNFETYVEFQEQVATLVEDLDEDLLEREAFEAAADALEQRTLRPHHFDRAREELASARELAELLDDWEAAREAHVDARRSAVQRRRRLEARIETLEDQLALGAADLDAPVESIREPLATYNEGIREAVRSFRREAPAREVLGVLETASAYPLVSVEPPPEPLRAYLADNPVGDRPVPELLEFADYSRSKLDHYVDDPDRLKRRLATNRTYLEGIDARPFEVAWPPPPARELRWWSREVEAILHRFAAPEVVESVRRVRRLSRDPDFSRLREAARARAELDPDDRERLRSGAIERELEEARSELATLEQALADHTED